MNCDAPASEIIVHKEDLVLGDLLFFIIVRCRYCLQRDVYKECTNETTGDECKINGGKKCEKDDCGYTDACKPCHLSSIHNAQPHPVNILVSMEYQ